MHVQFEFTQDDLIDASKRFSARLKAVRSFQWNGLLATAFLAWLLFFVFLYRTPIQGAIIGLIAAGLTALFYPGSNRKAVDKRMSKISRELFTINFLCEVLRPMRLRKSNESSDPFEWPSVEEIKETSDSVTSSQEGSGVVVRKPSFASPEERLDSNELERAGVASTRVKTPFCRRTSD